MLKNVLPLLCLLGLHAAEDLYIEKKYTFEIKAYGEQYRLHETFEGLIKPLTETGLQYAVIDLDYPFYAETMAFKSKAEPGRKKPRDFSFSPDYEDIFFSDQKINRHDFRGRISQNDTITYSYQRLYGDLAFTPILRFPRAFWKYGPVHIRFQHPEDIIVEFETFFPRGEVPVNIHRGEGLTTLTFTPASNEFEPRPYDPFNQDLAYIMPRIFKDGKPLDQGTAARLGPWYESLIRSHADLSPETIQQARAWIADASTPREKAAKLFEYVRDHIAYHADYVDFGAIIPREGDKVLESGYGDCKDRAFLLHNLGKELGLDIKMVLVQTGWMPPFNAVRITNYNHVVNVLVDGSEQIFFDPTLRHYEFADLSTGLAGKSALLLDGADSRVITLPLAEHRPEIELEITVDAAHLDQAEALVRMRQDYLAMARMGKLEMEEIDQENMLSNLVNLHLRQISLDYFEEVSDQDGYAVYKAKADLSKFIITSSKRLYLPCTPFALSDADILKRREDDQPLYFNSSLQVGLTLSLKHEGWTAPDAKNQQIGSDYSGFMLRFDPAPEHSRVRYDFKRRGLRLDGDQKQEFLDLTEKVLLMRKQMLRFTKE